MGNKMKQLLYILALTFLIIIFSCFKTENQLSICNDNYNKIYQLSFQHCGLGIDSIVLTRDTINELYKNIFIYRNKKLLFEYTEKNLEVVGTPFNIFTEHEISVCKEYYYIFKVFGAPGPNKYLIIKSTKDSTFFFGITKTNTAEIFGDIDHDGKFEIGGFEWYCEAKDSTCHPRDLYNISVALR